MYERFTEILVKVRESICDAWLDTDHSFLLASCDQARQNKSPNKPDNELNEFEQVSPACILFVQSLSDPVRFKILEEHKRQGEADQALENRVKGKKAAAKKKASKKSKPGLSSNPPIAKSDCCMFIIATRKKVVQNDSDEE